jgi:hypothetical protein
VICSSSNNNIEAPTYPPAFGWLLAVRSLPKRAKTNQWRNETGIRFASSSGLVYSAAISVCFPTLPRWCAIILCSNDVGSCKAHSKSVLHYSRWIIWRSFDIILSWINIIITTNENWFILQCTILFNPSVNIWMNRIYHKLTPREQIQQNEREYYFFTRRQHAVYFLFRHSRCGWMINCYFVRRMRNVCARVRQHFEFSPAPYPHIQWERKSKVCSSCVLQEAHFGHLPATQSGSFFLNMYLTIISDLSLAETKTSLLSLPLSTLRNMKAIHYLYCSRCGVEWRKKVKENLFWTEHYLFMVHEAWAAWSAAQKGILHSNIFLKSPGTFIYFCGALLCILLPLEWFLSQAAGCVCFGAWQKVPNFLSNNPARSCKSH